MNLATRRIDCAPPKRSVTEFKREKEDLIPQVKDVITAGDFYDLAEGAQIIFT